MTFLGEGTESGGCGGRVREKMGRVENEGEGGRERQRERERELADWSLFFKD